MLLQSPDAWGHMKPSQKNNFKGTNSIHLPFPPDGCNVTRSKLYDLHVQWLEVFLATEAGVVPIMDTVWLTNNTTA
jgi:hypothetical protein